jgi:hypothetical protein
MIALLCFVLAVLIASFKSKSRLEAENAALRHQLSVLRRKVHGRVRLTNNDRLFLTQLYRWFPSILTDDAENGCERIRQAAGFLQVLTNDYWYWPEPATRKSKTGLYFDYAASSCAEYFSACFFSC